MKVTKITYICDNCGKEITDGSPVYQVQESRAVISKEVAKIVPTTVKPAMICEKCFERMMEKTHEVEPVTKAEKKKDPHEEVKKEPEAPISPRKLTDKVLHSIWNMRKAGKSVYQIHIATGVSEYRIRKLLDNPPAGVPPLEADET